MPTTTMERRLAAILSADVQGYSRLMSEDEEVTIRTLTTYQDVMALEGALPALEQQRLGAIRRSASAATPAGR